MAGRAIAGPYFTAWGARLVRADMARDEREYAAMTGRTPRPLTVEKRAPPELQ